MKHTPNISFADAKIWPIQEAVKVINRIKQLNKAQAVFAMGYGPSGLPHMGTVAEVIRTNMIKKAFHFLTNKPAKLIAFVDDMDGFRKVPANVPNQEMLAKELHKPLCKVKDPFEETESFGHFNIKRLEQLLEKLGYLDHVHIIKASEQYHQGHFNQALNDILKHHHGVLAIMAKHLGSERQKTYSPFMPISPVTGHVLAKGVKEYKANSIIFEAEDKQTYETPVTDGSCKLQWKPDFGMRWHALGVDYEMFGKDLESSVDVAQQICKLLGSPPPEGMRYEHFLAEDGGRVSKSKGNETVTLDDWLTLTPQGTLEHFLFQHPQRAKRMRLQDLPNYVEAFLTSLDTYYQNIQKLTDDGKLPGNPEDLIIKLANDQENASNAYHENHLVQLEEKQKIALLACLEAPFLYMPKTPPHSAVSFKLALSLACALHPHSPSIIIDRMQIPEHDLFGLEIANCAFRFFQKHIASILQTQPIPSHLHTATHQLIELLQTSPTNAPELQNCFFQIAKQHNIPMGKWFQAMYQALLGTEEGPKLGTFCMMYGVDQVIAKLENALR